MIVVDRNGEKELFAVFVSYGELLTSLSSVLLWLGNLQVSIQGGKLLCRASLFYCSGMMLSGHHVLSQCLLFDTLTMLLALT